MSLGCFLILSNGRNSWTSQKHPEHIRTKQKWGKLSLFLSFQRFQAIYEIQINSHTKSYKSYPRLGRLCQWLYLFLCLSVHLHMRACVSPCVHMEPASPRQGLCLSRCFTDFGTVPSTDPFNNDVIRGKALNSVSFVLNEFYQIANVEPKLTTYYHKRVNNLEMSGVSTISHEERLLPQCFSAIGLKVWRHKSDFSEIIGFIRFFRTTYLKKVHSL